MLNGNAEIGWKHAEIWGGLYILYHEGGRRCLDFVFNMDGFDCIYIGTIWRGLY